MSKVKNPFITMT